jgi:hypothetical protein
MIDNSRPSLLKRIADLEARCDAYDDKFDEIFDRLNRHDIY